MLKSVPSQETTGKHDVERASSDTNGFLPANKYPFIHGQDHEAVGFSY